jgi:glycosyltransferase involved in cell wall biosynthesis
MLGGIQTVTSQLAETLVKRGERVTVVTNVSRKAYKPIETICGVPVIRFHFVYRLTYLLLFMLFLVRRPKVVYVHFPLDQAPFILRLRRSFKFKLITCFHGHDVLRYDEVYTVDSDCYRGQRRLIEISDAVAACSRYLARKVEEVFDCKDVTPVYNGVDLSRYEVATADKEICDFPYIFAFGRLERVKGFNLLIDAFAKVRCQDNLKLLIAGSGTLHDELQEQIAQLHLQDRVKLIGRKSPDEIVQLTKQAKAIVIPSFREPFGIVALEAIAAKRPIVATNAGGLPEVMDSRFGYLVEPAVDSIAFGIETALTSGQSLDFSGVDAYLRRFTIDAMVDNYLKLAL